MLSKISDRKQRGEINNTWKRQIQRLHEYDDKADLAFFHAWFRGKYAQTIRQGKGGSENQDFENIGTAFHKWFRDNHEELLGLSTSKDFYSFFKNEFPFFVNVYLQVRDACGESQAMLINWPEKVCRMLTINFPMGNLLKSNTYGLRTTTPQLDRFTRNSYDSTIRKATRMILLDRQFL